MELTVKIAVFGLGYVGCVTAAKLASRGHTVIGVDTLASKVDAINGGLPTVIEPGLDALVAGEVAHGRLSATMDGREAVATSGVSLVCVGTPSAPNGSLSTAALSRAIATIGEALPHACGRHTVVVRSTMLPGTSEATLIPLLEEMSGLRVGRDVGFAVNPEFLREGTSLADFDEPVKTVIGEVDPSTGDVVEELYRGATGTVLRFSVRAAEMTKYVDNAYHALKATFANEVGAVCRAYDLDSHDVLRSFFVDTKLNISAAYLKPGFAFGGSCLPKDLRALLYAARRRDVDLPVLESVLVSNEKCIARVVDSVISLGRRRVGMFGLSFKPDTDDLRESPFVELGERLLGKGFDLKIYDPQVSLARLVGANLEYTNERLPHLSALLTDSARDVMDHAEVCIVGAAEEHTVHELTRSNGRVIVDLVRLPDACERRTGEGYIGVAW